MEGTVITSDGNGYGCNEDIEPKPADQFMGLLVNILSSLLGKTPTHGRCHSLQKAWRFNP